MVIVVILVGILVVILVVILIVVVILVVILIMILVAKLLLIVINPVVIYCGGWGLGAEGLGSGMGSDDWEGGSG